MAMQELKTEISNMKKCVESLRRDNNFLQHHVRKIDKLVKKSKRRESHSRYKLLENTPSDDKHSGDQICWIEVMPSYQPYEENGTIFTFLVRDFENLGLSGKEIKSSSLVSSLGSKFTVHLFWSEDKKTIGLNLTVRSKQINPEISCGTLLCTFVLRDKKKGILSRYVRIDCIKEMGNGEILLVGGGVNMISVPFDDFIVNRDVPCLPTITSLREVRAQHQRN